MIASIKHALHRLRSRVSRREWARRHFGLGHHERRKQAEGLLGPDWLGHPDCQGPSSCVGISTLLPHHE